jgi:hypothetical protein
VNDEFVEAFPSTALMGENPMNRLAASLFGVVIA